MADRIALQDNRVLGCAVYEILSLPEAGGSEEQIKSRILSIRENFSNMLNELHRFCPINDAVFEIMWLGDSVKSRVRLYLSIRLIAKNISELDVRLDSIKKNIEMHLQTGGYRYSARTVSEMSDAGLPGKQSSVNALVKSEKFSLNQNLGLPYYHCDTASVNPEQNFEFLSKALLQAGGGAVVLQLIPTQWQAAEASSLQAMTGTLRQVMDGIETGMGMPYRDPDADIPYKCFRYYTERLGYPVFGYNLLAVGSQEQCVLLTSQIQSLMRGDNDSRYEVVNLNGEGLSIRDSFIYYPWNINKKLVYTYRNQTIWRSGIIPQTLLRLPYVMSTEECAGFFRLPLFDGHIEGFRNELVTQHSEAFSANPDKSLLIGNVKEAGDVRNTLYCPLKQLTKHMFIAGMPGTGKTTFSVNMLLQLVEHDIPFLVIEPSKTEYRALIDAIPSLQVFTPGRNRVAPFVINPFLPPKNVSVEQYIPNLMSAFEASFSMEGPLKAAFMGAINEAFVEYGWRRSDTAETTRGRAFGLYEFARVFKRRIGNSDYSSDVKGNIETGGTLRLLNLIEQNPDIYDTVHSVPIDELLTTPTVIELGAIDNAEQKSLIMALLLSAASAYASENMAGDGELKTVMMIDEAHVLLDSSQHSQKGEDAADAQSATVKGVQNMIVEKRSAGLGFIIADQSPAKIGKAIVDNIDIKVVFKVVGTKDKAIVADSTNMDELSERNLGILNVGEALVHFGKLQTPQLVVTEDIRAKKNIRLVVSNQEVAERATYWNTRKKLLVPFAECECSNACGGSCDFALREDAEFYAAKLYISLKDRITGKKELLDTLAYLHRDLYKLTGGTGGDQQRFIKLSNCVKIRFLRKTCVDKRFYVNEDEYQHILKTVLR